MLSDAEIVAIRDELLPSQGEAFDCIAFARAIEARLLNTPELHDFARGLVLEALHQRQRWGSEHDAGKEPADWHWLLAYLAGKALHHAHELNHLQRLSLPSSGAREAMQRHREKAMHHVITLGAAVANWHAAMLGLTNMRPGIDPAAHGVHA